MVRQRGRLTLKIASMERFLIYEQRTPRRARAREGDGGDCTFSGMRGTREKKRSGLKGTRGACGINKDVAWQSAAARCGWGERVY